MSLFQNSSSGGGSPLQVRGEDISIFRRLSTQGPHLGRSHQSHTKDNITLYSIQSPYKHPKVNNDTRTRTRIHWHSPKVIGGKSFTTTTQICPLNESDQYYGEQSTKSARTCLQLLGHVVATTYVMQHARLHMHC